MRLYCLLGVFLHKFCAHPCHGVLFALGSSYHIQARGRPGSEASLKAKGVQICVGARARHTWRSSVIDYISNIFIFIYFYVLYVCRIQCIAWEQVPMEGCMLGLHVYVKHAPDMYMLSHYFLFSLLHEDEFVLHALIFVFPRYYWP